MSKAAAKAGGYFSSEDNFSDYIGKELVGIRFTDTALKQSNAEDPTDYLDEGGIQFVDFIFADNSVFQLAVYNAHNGYYGHSILFVKDDEVLLNNTL